MTTIFIRNDVVRGPLLLKFLIRDCKKSNLRLCHAKTPVQQFGWEYLKTQKAMGRPLSPHLNIYKPQLTWLISGGHRIAGCVMSGTLFVGVLLFGLGPFSYTAFIERIRSWELSGFIVNPIKFIVASTIVFHTLNGIRFMGFDLAKGIELKQVYLSGYIVLGLSVLLAVLIVANSERISMEQQKVRQMTG